jgi:serine/threonine protein kinase
MPALPPLVKCLLKAALRNVGKPFGLDFIGATIADTWDQWDKNRSLAEKLKELESIAQKSMDEFMLGLRSEFDSLKQELNPIDLTLAKEEDIITLLAQVPGQIQKAFRRPSDPSGKTVPSDTVLRTAADLNFILPTEMPKFRPGMRPYPNYELLKPLGTGGFSSVWLAREVSINQNHVLKFGFTASQLRERYGSVVAPDANPIKHEAAIQAKLAEEGCTEGIVLPISSYLKSEPYCLVYEYMPDGDLAGYISDLHSGNTKPEQIQQTAHNIMFALATYLAKPHAANVVHRDLKPANILFKRDANGQLVPRVADYGIGGFAARNKINPNAPTQGYTGYQTTMMLSSHSPIYASPQQIRMEEPDPSDDIYALGVLWYQLLTGDKMQGSLAIPADWQDDLKAKKVPEGYIQLISRCLNPKREKRIANAQQLMQLMKAEFDLHDVNLKQRREAEQRERQQAEARQQQEQERQRREAEAEERRKQEQRRAKKRDEAKSAAVKTAVAIESIEIGVITALLLGLFVGCIGGIGWPVIFLSVKCAGLCLLLSGATFLLGKMAEGVPDNEKALFIIPALILGISALVYLIATFVFPIAVACGYSVGGPEEWKLFRFLAPEVILAASSDRFVTYLMIGSVIGLALGTVGRVVTYAVTKETTLNPEKFESNVD